MKQKLTYFRRTRTFVLSLLLLSCMAAQGQQQPSRMVKGLVKDARTGEPLAGVAVLVRGTTQGTTTGISGEYAVSVPSGSTELEFSFLGYVAKIQKIGTAHTLDVTMEEEATGLQEVVVVGYGVQKKANPAGFAFWFGEHSPRLFGNALFQGRGRGGCRRRGGANCRFSGGRRRAAPGISTWSPAIPPRRRTARLRPW